MRIPDLQANSDEELVRAFVTEDDRDALEVLLRRHETRVYGLAFRLLGNRADALDAAQDAFLNLFRKAHSFKGEAAFSTWLHRLTVNACRDLGRKRSRAPEPVQQPEVAEADALGRADDRMLVESALAGLPEEQRTATILRDLQGHSYQEISEITGVPVGTVKSRIARARMSLAGLLAHQISGGEPASETTRLTDTER